MRLSFQAINHSIIHHNDPDCLKTPTMSDMLQTPTPNQLTSPFKHTPAADDTPRFSFSQISLPPPPGGQRFFGENEPLMGKSNFHCSFSFFLISLFQFLLCWFLLNSRSFETLDCIRLEKETGSDDRAQWKEGASKKNTLERQKVDWRRGTYWKFWIALALS